MRKTIYATACVAAATATFVLATGETANAKPSKNAEKCLAEAIYFEARGESRQGQMIVGQVILNRVASGRFPDTVCGVVYQNASRRNACQFSFACDGQPEAITEKRAWKTAESQARKLLDCDDACREEKGWTEGLWASTHYHADYVMPTWASKLRQSGRVGTHLFYVEAAS